MKIIITNRRFLLASPCGREPAAERTDGHWHQNLQPAAAAADHRTQTAAHGKDSVRNQLS